MQERINKPARTRQPLTGFPKVVQKKKKSILPSTSEETVCFKSCRLHGDKSNFHTQHLMEVSDYKKSVIFRYWQHFFPWDSSKFLFQHAKIPMERHTFDRGIMVTRINGSILSRKRLCWWGDSPVITNSSTGLTGHCNKSLCEIQSTDILYVTQKCIHAITTTGRGEHLGMRNQSR